MLGEFEGRCLASGAARRAPGHPVRFDDADTEDHVRRLVEEATAGDRDAMRELYVRFAPSVHAYVSRIVNRDDADDVTQQIFAKLLTELWRYEPRGTPFRAWVLRVARNVAIDHLRHNRTVPCEEVRAMQPHFDDGALERRASLSDALSTLTAGQRDVLVLRHLVGLTSEEIAARLGRSVRSVYCLHHRGRAAARIALRERGSAPATVARLLPPAWDDSAELEAMTA
jgi:RNA polymerase sigma-70 factor (ECF subfamily)